MKTFIDFCLKDTKYLKKKLLKEKFKNKKYKLKNVKVSLENLLKEKIETESSLLNNYMRGVNKILPLLTKIELIDSFFEENLTHFFKFSRIAYPKLAIKLMSFLFAIVKHDFYSKLAERFMNLFYDSLNSTDIFHSKTSEHIFNLIFNIAKSDYSFTRICAFIKRLF